MQIVEKFADIRTRKIFSSTLHVGKGETGEIAECEQLAVIRGRRD